MAEEAENELLDYEEASDNEAQGDASNAVEQAKKEVKGTYVSIHSSGFRDFLLKPELLRAIVDCGFEHPSEGKFLKPKIINVYLIPPVPRAPFYLNTCSKEV